MEFYNLKSNLDKIYNGFDFKGRILCDPIKFPKRYSNIDDIELSAFISSCFAYGQVDVFMSVIEKLLGICGSSPYDFLMSLDIEKHRRLFDKVKYRFNDTEDIICLFYCLNKILRTYNSLKNVFLNNYFTKGLDVLVTIDSFVEEFLSIDTTQVYGQNIKKKGFRQFLPSPKDKSPCKRVNLFLRWMVRDSDIDFGIWKEIPKDKLIIPLDTHIARISRCLGLTQRQTVDIKMAVEITENLKRFDPIDPLKYDFALCHLGISGGCNAKRCSDCSIKFIP